MRTIITPEEARNLGRPIGKVSNDKLLAFITEVERTTIRRKLGDTFYLAILDELDKEEDEDKDEAIAKLLDGGTYETSSGTIKFLEGLKVAESYFVYAQNVRAGDFESTRYGMVTKNDEYSTAISSKDRDNVANNATEIGTFYLNECMEYCLEKGLIVTSESKNGLHLTNGCVIRKIRNR